MSTSKSDYPHRPPKERPKKPSKGVRKPSRTSGGGKRKSWVSLCEKVENHKDVGARRNFPWWKAPIYVAARLKKASLEK